MKTLRSWALRALMLAASFALAASPTFAASGDRAFVMGYQYFTGNVSALILYQDSTDNSITDINFVPFAASSTDTQAHINAATIQAVKDYSTLNGYNLTSASEIVWPYATYADVDSKIAAATSSLALPQAMSFANPTRSLNSAFQVSSTRASSVSYTVDVATTLSLTAGQTGTVTLQYADDSGFTTNVKTVQSAVNGNTGTLAIGLGLTQTGTAAVSGIVPAGKYVKIVTANTAGTPTFTFRAAQEVLLPLN